MAIMLLEFFIIFIFIYNITLALSIMTFIIVIFTFFDIHQKIMDWTIFKPNLVIEKVITNRSESQIEIIIKNDGDATAYTPQSIRYIISNEGGDVVHNTSTTIPIVLLPNKQYLRKISTKTLEKNEHYELRFILVDKEYLIDIDL